MAGIFGNNINSRSEFLKELGAVKELSERILHRLPYEDPLKSVLKQLQAIERWTANDRAPTPKERKSLDFSLRMFREYETTDDDEIADVRDRVEGIQSYVEHWPDDATDADPDYDGYIDEDD